TDRRRESVTVTAKVAGGLPVQTQSKATQFYQYANLTITGLVNDGCFITCTVTVNAHAQDIDGNPLSGLSVGSQSPTYGGGSTGFTLPPTDASGNAAIQRPMTTAAVDTGVYVFADAAHNAGVIPATRAGTFTSEYRSATTTVTTSALAGVSTVINPYTFAANSGFPQTGFAGAQFTVNLSGGNPTSYQWAVDGTNNGTAYTSVSTSGVVTLNSGHSGLQTVQVKNKSTGVVMASYTFTQTGWFTGDYSISYLFADAATYCSTRGGMVYSNQVGDGTSTRMPGRLVNEWGSFGNISSADISGEYAWTQDSYTPPSTYSYVITTTGQTGVNTNLITRNYRALCRKAL
ncbi:hypothetical protein LOD26_25435, partial [Citrobacter sp. BR102]|nr:hypothetical protein [Citrobacter meridianamericanus]